MLQQLNLCKDSHLYSMKEFVPILKNTKQLTVWYSLLPHREEILEIEFLVRTEKNFCTEATHFIITDFVLPL